MKPGKILMCEPRYFEVSYIGNEFMKNNIGNVDKRKAMEQWNELKNIYAGLGYEVEAIAPAEGLVDMVFTANQSLPLLDTAGGKKVILSKMRNPERQQEIKHFKKFFQEKNYEVIELPAGIEYFESMGDAVIDYEREMIFGGYGSRTQESTYDILANYTKYKIVKLKLVNPVLYHLDTCFSILNRHTVIIDKSAFDHEGIDLIRLHFEHVIYADEAENLKYFICNSHCPDGKNVIVQKGSTIFKDTIKKAGFNLIEIDTGEFMKSGGSVFCMKLMFY